LKGKDLLTFAELDGSDIDLLMKLSSTLKRTRSVFREPIMQGLTQLLIFQKPSTRTRVSFEIAMRELGGDSVALSANELQLGRGETIEDTAKVLSRYGHLMMARVSAHEDVVRLARASTIPVINGLSDDYHPVQILADLFTLAERKGGLKGLKVAWDRRWEQHVQLLDAGRSPHGHRVRGRDPKGVPSHGFGAQGGEAARL
jgi:ornithine carbamoyltransferase